MLSVKDEKILSFVPDYRINLIAPAHMDKTSMDKLRTSLREVLLYIKYSKDKKKLNELVLSDERFKHVERSAAAVINVITHSKITFDEKEESIDMCQEIQTYGFPGTYKLLAYPNYFYKGLKNKNL